MITLTRTAHDAIQQLLTHSANGQDTGMRIAADGPPSGNGASPAMTLALTAGPEPGDQVLEQDGVRVFLDATAAQLLGEQTLDAQVDDSAEVAFFVTPQTS